jgi:hypothetical protein
MLRSFDHFVGDSKQTGGNCGPERIRGFTVDDELELGRLLDRKVGRLGVLKDLIHECCRAPKEVDEVRTVGYQAPVVGEFAKAMRVRRLVSKVPEAGLLFQCVGAMVAWT